MIRLAIALLAGATIGTADRSEEGEWHVVDQTDNNLGERSVYAFVMHADAGGPDFVTLTMDCEAGQPVLYVDWTGLPFPDRAVIGFSATDDPDGSSDEVPFVFQKVENKALRDLVASSADSERIVEMIGSNDFTTIAAHSTSGTRFLTLELFGAAEAWQRVKRHCPSSKVPIPPL